MNGSRYKRDVRQQAKRDKRNAKREKLKARKSARPVPNKR
jgi:hypothetical protein